jgi:hypothetical protein
MKQDQDEDLAWKKELPCELLQFHQPAGLTVLELLRDFRMDPEKVHLEVFLGERLIRPADWARVRCKDGDVLNVHMTPPGRADPQ